MSSPVMPRVDSPDQVRLWLVLGVVRADPELGRFGVDSCKVRLQAGEQQMRESAGTRSALNNLRRTGSYSAGVSGV